MWIYCTYPCALDLSQQNIHPEQKITPIYIYIYVEKEVVERCIRRSSFHGSDDCVDTSSYQGRYTHLNVAIECIGLRPSLSFASNLSFSLSLDETRVLPADISRVPMDAANGRPISCALLLSGRIYILLYLQYIRTIERVYGAVYALQDYFLCAQN